MLGELTTTQTQFDYQLYQTITTLPILSGLFQDFVKVVDNSGDTFSLVLVLDLQQVKIRSFAALNCHEVALINLAENFFQIGLAELQVVSAEMSKHLADCIS